MSGARITVRRVVEFTDTDMSGHYHNGSVIRWLEAAEAELHDRLGIVHETFGQCPRVSVQLDFRARLYFWDAVDITLAVAAVGNSSVRYALEVHGRGALAVTGTMVAVFVPRGAERSQPWPEHLRAALAEGGDVGGQSAS